MNDIVLAWGELPFIFMVSIAAYLSFEHWKFPDLSIESSFISGMVATYLTLNYVESSGFTNYLWIIAFMALPILYTIINFMLIKLNFPPIFSGLVVLLAAYSLNFILNNHELNQVLALEKGLTLMGFPAQDVFFIFYIIIAIVVACIVLLLDRSKFGIKIKLSRTTKDPNVISAIGINHNWMLLYAMIIYNLIAYISGIGYSLTNNQSVIEFFAAISPALACVFSMKGIKHLASLPSKRIRSLKVGALNKLFLKWSDSLLFVFIVLFLLSSLFTWVRFGVYRAVESNLSLINAYTAFGIVIVWGVISFIGYVMGKQVLTKEQ